MKRFNHPVVAALSIASVLLLGVGAAVAAAPTVTQTATTTLTSVGRTDVTYTGLMNGESFQQDGIVSYNGWQYTAYWDSSGYVNVSRRQLPSGSWQNARLTDYQTTSTDSHNTISIGISKGDGTIHLAFDHHVSTLHYRKSVTGLATNPAGQTWTPSLFGAVQNQLTGPTMTQITYPQFISAPGGKLQLAVRVGNSGSGDEVLYEYNSGTWTSVGKFIDGISSSKNAYLFGIEYDNSGRLQTTWTWRETSNASSNHDLLYAYSTDQGRTWRNNAGATIATSGSSYITPTSTGTKVWTIGQNRGLINQESQVVDANGVIHVLASHLPAAAANQSNFTTARATSVIVHYWRTTDGVWHQTYTPFLENSSRGDIVADANSNLYVVSGDSTTHKLHIQTASAASGWTDWTLRYTSSAVYFSDPLLDHELTKTAQKLSIFATRYNSGVIDIQDWTIN